MPQICALINVLLSSLRSGISVLMRASAKKIEGSVTTFMRLDLDRCNVIARMRLVKAI